MVDIERQMNNRPLTYLESEIEEIEEDRDEVSKLHKQLKEAKQHVWKRWKREYIHSLLESQSKQQEDWSNTGHWRNRASRWR